MRKNVNVNFAEVKVGADKMFCPFCDSPAYTTGRNIKIGQNNLGLVFKCLSNCKISQKFTLIFSFQEKY